MLRGLLIWMIPFFAIGQEATGVLYPHDERVLSFSQSGLVKRVPVEPGSLVAKGDVLVQLDDRAKALEVSRRDKVRADRFEISSVTEQLKTAKAQLVSAEKLYAEAQVVSLDELRRLRLDVTSLQARLGQLESDSERTRIEYDMAVLDYEQQTLTSPMAGTVTQITRDEGEWISAGDPIAEVVDTSQLELRANIEATSVWRRVERGMMLLVRGEQGQTREGRVTYVSPVADASSGLVEVHFLLNNSDAAFLAGTQGIVSLPHGQ